MFTRSEIWLAALAALALALSCTAWGQSVQVTELQPGRIVGTVTDVNNDAIPHATVVLDGLGTNDHRELITTDIGYFEFQDVRPGTPYQVNVRAHGFAEWISPVLVAEPGQFKILPDIQLRISVAVTVVQVTYNPVEVATQEVKLQEQQRVFGFIPNFYVVYDSNAAPLTPKLKFDLAFKTATDAVTAVGILLLSAMQQAGDTPAYGQGFKGFSKRVGSNSAGGFSDIMIGGAILPSLLHQDPRYFYQGTGTTTSRIRHAVFNPFVCKGDNGRWQPNYSSLGGDLSSSAIANLYYPKSNRGAGTTLTNFAIDTGERVVASLAQEFLLRGVTHKAGHAK